MDPEFESELTDPRGAQVVARFLRDYFKDQDAGRVRSLREYLSTAGEFETVVKEAYHRLVEGENTEVQAERIRDTTFEPGQQLDPYEIIAEVAAGGQGVVYAARDPRIDRKVALKVLRLSSRDNAAKQRFDREARVAANLDHPGICPVLDVRLNAEPPHIVMPWIEGQSFSRFIGAEREVRDRADLERRLLMVEEAADALHVAHEAGVLHRDVKPGNLMRRQDGRVVVLDFGLATKLGGSEAPTLTEAGQVLGTLPYMSPEQLRGAELDRRSDVYSLGVTLHELLTCGMPHEGVDFGSRLLAIHEGKRRPLPSHLLKLSPDLAAVVDAALEVDPDRRYSTMAEFREDLRRLRLNETPMARPLGAFTRLGRWCLRHPALAFMTSLTFLLLSLGLVGALVLLDRVKVEQSLAENRLIAEEKQRVLAEERLAENQRWADHGLIGDLEDQSRFLWPLVTSIAPDLELWIESCADLLGREAGYLADLERLRAIQAPSPAERRSLVLCGELLAGLARLKSGDGVTLAVMQSRYSIASEMRKRTVEDRAEDWTDAAKRLVAKEAFAGFVLQPLEGFVPLGPDPDTGFEEFAVAVSGAIPTRDRAGILQLTSRSAAILVLLPGGTMKIGANVKATAGIEEHIDPRSRDFEAPVHSVQLAPYMIGKHELSQAQFMTVILQNPSENYQLEESSPETLMRHPVDSVDWSHARTAARWMGCELPTEAQWEVACRAGTGTVFSTGDAPNSLVGFANLADEASRSAYDERWSYEPGFTDCFIGHAPIGQFKPNAFGLHDMHGNVWEWCLDNYGGYEQETRPGDGLRRPTDNRYRMLRGGSFFFESFKARSAHRELITPVEQRFHIGMRLAYTIQSP